MSEEVAEILGVVWDNANAAGLDGWIGPGRGAGEVDDEAISIRERDLQKAEAKILDACKPRVITTAEELDGLAHGSVIVDRDGDAWQRYTTGWTCADRAMNTVDQPSVNLTNILGPATVLWEPK